MLLLLAGLQCRAFCAWAACLRLTLRSLRLSLAGASSIEQLRRTLENTDASWDEPLPPALAEAFEAAWAALSVGAPHGVPLVGGVAPVASI